MKNTVYQSTNISNSSPKRPYKGKSLLCFPQNYAIIDIETTGVDPRHDRILEVSAIKVANNNVSATFSAIIKQPDINISDYPFVQKLTGITQDMIDNGTDEKTALTDFAQFINECILVGHNANFDINFLYDNLLKCDILLNSDFVDTMRISRRLFPDFPHHRLTDIAQHFGIDTKGSHRALKDCEITKECFDLLHSTVLKQYENEEAFASTKPKHKASTTSDYSVRAKDIIANCTNFDETNPFYNKVCVFTGALQIQRKTAMQLIADLGGIPADNVTKKTNFLILGNNDYCPTIKDGKSSKHKKAEQLKADGQDIEILSEDVFADMLNSISSDAKQGGND